MDHLFDPEVARDHELVRRIRALKLMAFDFDGVFTDNAVIVDQNGIEHVRASRYDGIGLRLIERAGIKPVIISTEVNAVVRARAEKMKIDCYNGCEDKVSVLQAVMDGIGASFESTAFLGNDVNDLPVLSRVALPMVTADCHPAVRSIGAYVTRTPGGNGAVREICDMIHHFAESVADIGVARQTEQGMR